MPKQTGNPRKRKEGTVQIPEYFKLQPQSSSKKQKTCILLNVSELKNWGINEVVQFLEDKGLPDVAKVFKGMKII